MDRNIAIVIVTYNRASLLEDCINAILKQYCINIVGSIYIIDNASKDDTQMVIKKYQKDNNIIKNIKNDTNLGGAGGFHQGIKLAFDDGFSWIWVMDDDVLPKADCLSNLLKYGKEKVLIPVREDKFGNLIELSALSYNLTNPFIVNPKTKFVSQVYSKRDDLPEKLSVVNFSFEGLLIHKDVVHQVGFPYVDYFIFYDDADYAQRIINSNIKIYAVRDAVLVRQLEFNQKEALKSWKSYYMYRNFFIIHFLYGKNILVKLKPFILTFFGIFLAKFIDRNPPTLSCLKDAIKLAKKIKINNK